MIGVLQHLLNAWPKEALAGLLVVAICLDDLPAPPFRIFMADAKLILDRDDFLERGGVAGINGNTGHGQTLSLGFCRMRLRPGLGLRGEVSLRSASGQ